MAAQLQKPLNSLLSLLLPYRPGDALTKEGVGGWGNKNALVVDLEAHWSLFWGHDVTILWVNSGISTCCRLR